MTSQRFINRVNKELVTLERDPPPHIVCYPCEDNITQLIAYFHGPPGTAYESGLFRLEVILPVTYPFDPPSIRFVTPIYHPNIDDSGRICASILKKGKDDQWKPSMNLRTTLISLHALMGAPNPDDPLDADVAREYQHDYDLFFKKAKEHTKKHAVDKPDKVILGSNITADINTPHPTDDQNGSCTKPPDDNTSVSDTSSTIISQESTSTDTTIIEKPKRKSKLSLSHKKSPGSSSAACSQQSSDTATPAIIKDENETPNIHDKATTLSSDRKKRARDDKCVMEQQTDDNQHEESSVGQCEGLDDEPCEILGDKQHEESNNSQCEGSDGNQLEESNKGHCEGSNDIQGSEISDECDIMEKQTLDGQTDESNREYGALERRTDDNHEDEANHKSDEKQGYEQDIDDEKEQPDETNSVGRQICDNTNNGQIINVDDDVEQQTPALLVKTIDSLKISKTVNNESLSPIQGNSLPTSTSDIQTTNDPATTLSNCFINDDDIPSTLNNDHMPAPKRKRNKLSLSCKKKPKTA